MTGPVRVPALSQLSQRPIWPIMSLAALLDLGFLEQLLLIGWPDHIERMRQRLESGSLHR